MLLYEYECAACAHRFERIQKFSDPLVDVCPECGGAVRKLLSSPAIQFKGSGFYITDYARQGKGGGGTDTSESSNPTAATKAKRKKRRRKTRSRRAPTKRRVRLNRSQTRSPPAEPRTLEPSHKPDPCDPWH